MSKRVCPTPGCPNLVTKGKCTRCARQAEQARGSRQQRGYDAAHDRLRAEWQRRLDRGELVICWRCKAKGQPHPVNPNHWQLGHDDHDRARYRGPECPEGNQATAGRRR